MNSRIIAAASAMVIAGRLESQAANPSHYPVRGSAVRTVHSTYDKEHEATIVSLDPMPVDSTLELSATVSLAGSPVAKEAKAVLVTFSSTSKQKRFQRALVVTIAIDDGSSVALGDAFLMPDTKPGYSEILMKDVKLDQWLSIARATRARLTIGRHQFVLSAELLGAIRDFASRMTPDASAAAAATAPCKPIEIVTPWRPARDSVVIGGRTVARTERAVKAMYAPPKKGDEMKMLPGQRITIVVMPAATMQSLYNDPSGYPRMEIKRRTPARKSPD